MTAAMICPAVMMPMRVAVLVGARDDLVAERAAGARLVLDHDRLAELFLQRLPDDAGDDVAAAARPERHDDADALLRPFLRRRGRARGPPARQPASAIVMIGLFIAFPPRVVFLSPRYSARGGSVQLFGRRIGACGEAARRWTRIGGRAPTTREGRRNEDLHSRRLPRHAAHAAVLRQARRPRRHDLERPRPGRRRARRAAAATPRRWC